MKQGRPANTRCRFTNGVRHFRFPYKPMPNNSEYKIKKELERIEEEIKKARGMAKATNADAVTTSSWTF